jgi:hypothetical protein
MFGPKSDNLTEIGLASPPAVLRFKKCNENAKGTSINCVNKIGVEGGMTTVDMGWGTAQDKLMSYNSIIQKIGNKPFCFFTNAPTNWPWEDDRI